MSEKSIGAASLKKNGDSVMVVQSCTTSGVLTIKKKTVEIMESSVSHRVYQPTGLLGWISTAIEHPRAARMVQRSWKPPSSAQLGSDGF